MLNDRAGERKEQEIKRRLNRQQCEGQGRTSDNNSNHSHQVRRLGDEWGL